MALDGSAFVLILYRAFSSGDSTAATLMEELPLLLRFLPGNPSTDLGRDMLNVESIELAEYVREGTGK